jgi:germination protein, Ger(x)C family
VRTGEKKAFHLVLIISLILLSGCWDHQELTDIGFVTAVGVDKDKDGQILATFQIINPRNLTGGQSQSSANGVPIAVYRIKADNILDASRKISQQVSRQMYFAHTNLLVFSEEIARRGLKPYLDAIIRSPQYRSTATLVIVKEGRAEDLLSVLTPLDQVPSLKIEKTLEFSNMVWGMNISRNIQEVVTEMLAQGKQAVAGGFSVEGDKKQGQSHKNIQYTAPLAVIHADSIAVFKNDRLVKWAEDETARGINWLLDNIKFTVMNVPWKGKENAFGFIIFDAKTRIHPVVKTGIPRAHITIKVEGTVAHANANIHFLNKKERDQLAHSLEETIQQEAEKAIQMAQEVKSDIFGIGERISKTYPDYWKQVASSWDDVIFPELETKIKVEALIRRTRNKLDVPFYEERK